MSQPPESFGDGQAGASQPRAQSKRLQQTQAQVDEVVGIMKVNVEKISKEQGKYTGISCGMLCCPDCPENQLMTIMFKVLERDSKLSQLDDRADALQEGASQFEKSAATLKRKYWWKNLKMMLIIIAIVLVIIIIIVVWATK